MNNIKIKKNMVIPSAKTAKGFMTRSNNGKTAFWPLGEMEVNDGFETPVKNINAVRCSIQHHQRWYPGTKFTTKRVKNKVLVKRTN